MADTVKMSWPATEGNRTTTKNNDKREKESEKSFVMHHLMNVRHSSPKLSNTELWFDLFSF